MSTALMQRKEKITQIMGSKEIQERVVNLFANNKNKADKFKATILNIALEPSLRDCTPQSIIKSALQIAELDLPLAKGLGQAYIVRYKKDAEPVIGYKGWLALAKRYGIRINTLPVFKCDTFDMDIKGFTESFNLIPNYNERKDYNPKWCQENLEGVLVVTLEDSVENAKFVSKGKIDQLAGKSPSKNSKFSPYDDWYLEMYIGKAIKYVLSKTAMTEEIFKAVEVDNELDIKLQNEIKDEKHIDLNDVLNTEIEEEINQETGEIK
jgi:recombination protein RecT